MIEFMEQSSGPVLGVKASGRLSDEDYKQRLIPKLETLLKQHGRLDLLFYLDETFEGWDLAAAWDDATFGLSHRADFDKVAVVGGPSWIEWGVKLGGFLMKGEVRVFPAGQLDDAWAWVRGPRSETSAA